MKVVVMSQRNRWRQSEAMLPAGPGPGPGELSSAHEASLIALSISASLGNQS